MDGPGGYRIGWGAHARLDRIQLILDRTLNRPGKNRREGETDQAGSRLSVTQRVCRKNPSQSLDAPGFV